MATKGGKAVAAALTVGQVIDIPYLLWLATIACALMATIALTVVGAIYILDTVLLFNAQAPVFGYSTYIRVLELGVLFGAGAVVAHLMRLRLEAIRRASILVPLPYAIVTSPPGGDTLSRFECSCKVTLALDTEHPLVKLKQNPDMLKSYLENAFAVAVTDPVIRYSKAKMEQTLKIAAHYVLGDGVSGVIMSEVRQRRIPVQRPAPAVALDVPDATAVAG
ncbi:MAG: hypothetical protein RLO51_28750 [Thalassobaculum sp.]|uniref:hypothetical protein n=1 Tax=Thalassobaculum sp. TaxID=2022740 RepID=UPI0032EE9281